MQEVNDAEPRTVIHGDTWYAACCPKVAEATHRQLMRIGNCGNDVGYT
jgi:hypothetical protein